MDGASQKKCRQQVPKPFWPKQTAHSFFWWPLAPASGGDRLWKGFASLLEFWAVLRSDVEVLALVECQNVEKYRKCRKVPKMSKSTENVEKYRKCRKNTQNVKKYLKRRKNTENVEKIPKMSKNTENFEKITKVSNLSDPSWQPTSRVGAHRRC
jgi:hypothetical protein